MKDLSPRLAAIVEALPLRPGMRVLEIGCGPGAAARAIARRIGDGHILAIDRSAKAVRQAIASSAVEIASGRMSVRQVAIEGFELHRDRRLRGTHSQVAGPQRIIECCFRKEDRPPTTTGAPKMPEIAAAVLPAPGAAVEVRSLPEPELEPGSALLEVELSEVCGTDVHLRAGRLAGVPYPLVPGHVTVGRLAKVRGALRDVEGNPLREGDRVTFLDVHRTCNACWHCLVAKATTRCPDRRVYGITYGVADGPSGGWAEAVYLKPGTHLIPVGDLDAEAFMAGGCGLPTALHAVERAEIRLADTVLVLGAGPVGLSAVILAKMSGALRVLCIGAPELRLEAARAVGADATLSIEATSPEERLAWVLEHTGGRGADITIEAAGAPEAVVQAMRFTRDAGRVVVVGQYTDHGDVAFNPHADLNRKHLDVRGCWGSDYSHFYRAVRLMRDPSRSRPWSAIALERFGLSRANEALDAVAAGRVVKALIDPRT